MLRNRRCALAVEAEAIDDRAVGRQPEQPRSWIPRLRSWRHRSDFREAEAERIPAGNRGALLVEARGQPDRIAEPQADHVLNQRRVIVVGAGRTQQR